MSNKLFVGGLAWATTNESLKTAFGAYGEVVDARVITDRETGRSRGFGFVTFADAESAKTAQEKMDGSAVDGRNVRVNEAQERAPRSGPPRGGGGGYGGPPRGGGGGGGYGGPPRGGGGGGGYGGPPRDGGGGSGGQNYPPVERRSG
ncbi:MAG: RNA recognition motif domain-containing protein, partial [Sandaracinaceae bacterium]